MGEQTVFKIAMGVIDEAVMTADEIIGDLDALADVADAYAAVKRAEQSLAVLRGALETKLDEQIDSRERKRIAGDWMIERQFNRSEKWDHRRTMNAALAAEGLTLIDADGQVVDAEMLAGYLGSSAGWLKGKLREHDIECEELTEPGKWRVRWSVNPAPPPEE